MALPSPSLPDCPPGKPLALDGEVIPPKPRIKQVDTEPARDGSKKAPSYRLRLSTAMIACVVATAVGLGATGTAAYVLTNRSRSTAQDRMAKALDRLQDDLGHLKSGVETLHASAEAARDDEAVRSLKKSVDTLRAELDTLKTTSASGMAQLSAKLDKPDHDASPKLTDIAARLDRIEKQVSSPAPTGSIAAPVHAAPAPVQQTIATPVTEKPLPKPATLGNWIVRDVYDGIALVEGRAGGVREVAPGEFLPGAGEVRSIERRGRAWIVVTSRGIIDTSTW